MARRRLLKSYFYITYNGTTYKSGQSVQVTSFVYAGGTDSFSITTNKLWSITCPNWITLSRNSGGKGNSMLITMTAATNTSTDVRNGSIVVSDAAGRYSITLNVSQQGQSRRIEISPSAASIAATGQTALTCYYIEGESSPVDVTSQATWSSNNAAVTVVNGAVTANNTSTSPLTVTITATYQGLTTTATITVAAAVVTYNNYRFNPASMTGTSALGASDVADGKSYSILIDKLINGVFSETIDVKASSNVSVNDATVIGLKSGNNNVYPVYNQSQYWPTTRNASVLASYTIGGNTFNATMPVEVKPEGRTEYALSVSPATATIANTGTCQLTVIYITYVDGNVTTSTTVTNSSTYSSNQSVITVNGTGLVTANNMTTSPVTATITATYNGYSATAEITAREYTPEYLEITPALTGITWSGNTSLVCEYVNGSSRTVVTTAATWSSNNAAASVGNGANGGVVTGNNTSTEGTTATITATYNGMSTTAEVIVSGAPTEYSNIRFGLNDSSTATTLSLSSNQQSSTYKVYETVTVAGSSAQLDSTSSVTYYVYTGNTQLTAFTCDNTSSPTLKYNGTYIYVYGNSTGLIFESNNTTYYQKTYKIVAVDSVNGLSTDTVSRNLTVTIAGAPVTYRNVRWVKANTGDIVTATNLAYMGQTDTYQILADVYVGESYYSTENVTAQATVTIVPPQGHGQSTDIYLTGTTMQSKYYNSNDYFNVIGSTAGTYMLSQYMSSTDIVYTFMATLGTASTTPSYDLNVTLKAPTVSYDSLRFAYASTSSYDYPPVTTLSLLSADTSNVFITADNFNIDSYTSVEVVTSEAYYQIKKGSTILASFYYSSLPVTVDGGALTIQKISGGFWFVSNNQVTSQQSYVLSASRGSLTTGIYDLNITVSAGAPIVYRPDIWWTKTSGGASSTAVNTIYDFPAYVSGTYDGQNVTYTIYINYNSDVNTVSSSTSLSNGATASMIGKTVTITAPINTGSLRSLGTITISGTAVDNITYDSETLSIAQVAGPSPSLTIEGVTTYNDTASTPSAGAQRTYSIGTSYINTSGVGVASSTVATGSVNSNATTLTVDVGANPTTSTRSWNVVITGRTVFGTVLSARVNGSQDAAVSYYFRWGNGSTTATSASTSASTTLNGAWSSNYANLHFTTSNSWLTINSSGSPVSVSVAAQSEGAAARTGYIYAYTGSSTSNIVGTWTINQNAGNKPSYVVTVVNSLSSQIHVTYTWENPPSGAYIPGDTDGGDTDTGWIFRDETFPLKLERIDGILDSPIYSSIKIVGSGSASGTIICTKQSDNTYRWTSGYISISAGSCTLTYSSN